MEMDESLGQEDGRADGAEPTTPSAVSSLTGFLFGNIDEKGELEEDFLDEVCVMISGGTDKGGIWW